jgi:DNA-directed RNA polymerase specialized sigma24 family protein
MAISEPDREWQEQLHQRILRQEPTAFAELCEVALPHLLAFLRQRFPQNEAHLHEMTAVDTLLHYHTRPAQYDAAKLSLFAFLRMAARNDMLNLLDKHGRADKRLLDIDDPYVQALLPAEDAIAEASELDDWLSQHTQLSRQQLLQTLDNELTRTDKAVMLLMFDGVRDSRQYAFALGISHLDTGQQRAEVKRAKDRLTKKLQRFGKTEKPGF